MYGSGAFGSSSHQQPVQALPPSSPLALSPHSSHPVAFGAVPGSQPGTLGWGIGMSAANGAGFGFGAQASTGAGLTSPSSHHLAHQQHHRAQAHAPSPLAHAATPADSPRTLGWGAAAGPSRPASPSSPLTPHAAAAAAAGGAGGPSGSRRRRRSPSPDTAGDSGDDEPMTARRIRPMHSASSKRTRVATPVAAGSASADPFGAGSNGSPVVGDLGKALASLDKPALLDVFSRLLSTQPALASVISGLLPAPSLSTVLATLASLERAINAATPSGAFVRPEYIWSRVRVPVEDFVTESRRFLGLFVPAQPPQPGQTVTEEDLSHPSTCFEFLEALTRALLRLESALPSLAPSPSTPANPLAAHLLPMTFNAWHTFLTRLATAVQSHGKVLPNSLVETWFDRLDHLAAESGRDAFSFGSTAGAGAGAGAVVAAGAAAAAAGSSVRKAMEGVRDRAKKELGWLVGLKHVDHALALSSGMEGVEQYEDEEL